MKIIVYENKNKLLWRGDKEGEVFESDHSRLQ